MKKILLYSHYDPQNIVEDYVSYALGRFKEYGFSIVFCTRSSLLEDDKDRLSACVKEIVEFPAVFTEREVWKNTVACFKEEIEEILVCDHLLLLNDSCYGPLFPVAELFDRMQSADADFWSLTERYVYSAKCDPLASGFLCFPGATVRTEKFWNFWNSLAREDAADLSLAEKLSRYGFRFARAVDVKDRRQNPWICCKEPFCLYITDYLISHYRLSFIPSGAFVHDYSLPYNIGGLILRAAELSGSDYPQKYIYRHLNRLFPLSSLKNLPENTNVFARKCPEVKVARQQKIAVICHMFSTDALDEHIPYLRNIPQPFDLLVTTVSEQNKEAVLARRNAIPQLKNLIVRIVANHGRDVLPWLTAFKDIHDGYDLCLKIHFKKISDMVASFTFAWQHFTVESLMASPDYVTQILNRFAEDSHLGIMFPHMPPQVRMIIPFAVYEDADLRNQWLKMLGLSNHQEGELSIFSAGTMFWYRPQALYKLLHYETDAGIFPEEPLPGHTMAHGLERAITYIAQDSGYCCNLVIPVDLLLDSFHLYEDRFSSVMHLAAFQKKEPKKSYQLSVSAQNLTISI